MWKSDWPSVQFLIIFENNTSALMLNFAVNIKLPDIVYYVTHLTAEVFYLEYINPLGVYTGVLRG